MSFEVFLIILCIGLPIYVLYNYKFAVHLTNTYLYRKIGGVAILLSLAIAEYWYFKSTAMAIILTCVLAWETFKLLGVVSIIAYIVFTKKVDDKERNNYRLFFTNLTVRAFFKSKNPNVYFLKRNGIQLYYDSTSDCFKSMTDSSLDRFKEGMKTEKLDNVSLENFLVLLYNNQYLSVSSDDLSLLGIDLFDIDKNHFEVLRMFKI